MLDSTGSHIVEKITCALCPRNIDLETYKPKVGHDGYPLNCGPYFCEMGIRAKFELPKALLLKFVRKQKDQEIYFELQGYSLEFDGNPYAYGYPLVPSFGLSENKVIWVCASCSNLFKQDPAEIHYFLSKRLDEYYSAILNELKIRKKLAKKIKTKAA